MLCVQQDIPSFGPNKHLGRRLPQSSVCQTRNKIITQHCSANNMTQVTISVEVFPLRFTK